MIEAVLFDMDGLLVNTEQIYMQINFEICEAFGYSMTKELYCQMLGVVQKKSEQIYREHIPDFQSEAFHASFEKSFIQKLEGGEVEVKSGVFQLLEYLQNKGIPKAVATSSSSGWASMILRKMKLDSAFDAIVVGEAVKRSKPAPDIFLHAAEQLGVHPSVCLVLEDSENGVRAGRAAGMKVCMIPDILPYKEAYAPFCDYVRRDLGEVIRMIENVNGAVDPVL